MEKHEVTHLETLTKELRSNLRTLAEDKDLEQFLITIRHPGFTTPAEFALFRGVVGGILSPTKTIPSLKQVLASAATKAELPPQPFASEARRRRGVLGMVQGSTGKIGWPRCLACGKRLFLGCTSVP